MTFGFYTLGCKVNQYETQAMEQLLREMGHEIRAFQEPCDGYIINTCSVTAVADRKNRTIIRRCRREHPQSIIGVCGCYSQHEAGALEPLGVDVVGGSSQRQEFLEQMILALEKKHPHPVLDNPMSRRSFEVLPAGGLEGRTRAMVKVQDGCVNFCTYCIIPYTRGPVRSAPLSLAVEQAKELESQGYRELVITGIEIASWGVDLPGKPPVTELIEGICRAVPEMRVRLGSLEPRIVTEDFCTRLSALPNLCPQFHLSLQSGCDTVLQRMHRKYDTARYLQSVNLLKAHFPGCAITTDLIVAFPGETAAEFAQSLAFIQECGFADMHIFPYSKRPGTPAAKLPGQVLNAVKEERAHRAAALAARMEGDYLASFAGETVPVLFEEERDGLWRGHTTRYCEVTVQSPQPLHNQLRQVRLTGRDGGALQGVLV